MLHLDEIVTSLSIKSESEFIYTIDGDLYKSDGNLKVELGPRIKLINV